jgi:hypothetical protein
MKINEDKYWNISEENCATFLRHKKVGRLTGLP